MVKPSSPELARSGHTPVDPDAPSSTAPLEPHVERGEGMGPVPPENRPGRREEQPQDKPDLDAFAEHFRRHDDGDDETAAGDDDAGAALGDRGPAADALGRGWEALGHGWESDEHDDDAHAVLGDRVESSGHELAVEARRQRGPLRRVVRAACSVPVRAAVVGLTVTDAGLAVSRLTVQVLRSRLRNLERR